MTLIGTFTSCISVGFDHEHAIFGSNSVQSQEACDLMNFGVAGDTSDGLETIERIETTDRTRHRRWRHFIRTKGLYEFTYRAFFGSLQKHIANAAGEHGFRDTPIADAIVSIKMIPDPKLVPQHPFEISFHGAALHIFKPLVQCLALWSPPMVRVVAAVVIRDGRILVARRGPGVRMAGLGAAGGKVEAGEDDRSALACELMEEPL